MKAWLPQHLPYAKASRLTAPTVALSPPAVLALGFAALIILGALLLLLPIATTAPLSLLQALFTATSAVTVTGLVLVDTGTHFTVFGQVVIAMLIQAGGLGFMTFAVVAVVSLGAKIGLVQQKIAQEAMNQTSLAQVAQTAKAVLLYSLVIELIGVVLLTLVWFSELGFASALNWQESFGKCGALSGRICGAVHRGHSRPCAENPGSTGKGNGSVPSRRTTGILGSRLRFARE